MRKGLLWLVRGLSRDRLPDGLLRAGTGGLVGLIAGALIGEPWVRSETDRAATATRREPSRD
jgi:hypothetical protein